MLTVFRKTTHDYVKKELTLEKTNFDINPEKLSIFRKEKEEELILEHPEYYREDITELEDKKKEDLLKVSFHYVESQKFVHYGIKTKEGMHIKCGNEDVKVENKERYTNDKKLVTCLECKNKLNKK